MIDIIAYTYNITKVKWHSTLIISVRFIFGLMIDTKWQLLAFYVVSPSALPIYTIDDDVRVSTESRVVVNNEHY